MTHLKDTILAHINNGNIAMKPRWYFALRSIFLISGISIAILLSVYLLSFVLFLLRETGLWWAPQFGFRGLIFFVTMSPWLLISVTGLFLTSVYLLVRHYGHNYRHYTLYTLLGVVLAAVGGASVLNYFAIHDTVREYATRGETFGLSPLYREIDRNHPRDITPGRITNLKDTELIIVNPTGEYRVDISNITLPPHITLKIGDHVLVLGSYTGTTSIAARGIRPLPAPLERQLHRRDN
jgi:hypothetical protein